WSGTECTCSSSAASLVIWKVTGCLTLACSVALLGLTWPFAIVTLMSKAAAAGGLGEPLQATGPQTSPQTRGGTHVLPRLPRTVIDLRCPWNRMFLLDRLGLGEDVVDAARAPRQPGDDHHCQEQHHDRAGGEQPGRSVLVAFALQDRDLLHERTVERLQSRNLGCRNGVIRRFVDRHGGHRVAVLHPQQRLP